MNPFDVSEALRAHARLPEGRRHVLDDRMTPEEAKRETNRRLTAEWRARKREEARRQGISMRELLLRLRKGAA